VLAAVGQQGQDLKAAILDCRGQVFDRYGRQRRPSQPRPQVWTGPGLVTSLQASFRRAGPQPTQTGQWLVRWITPTSDNPVRTSCTPRAASRKPNTFSVTSMRLASR
jgi:hypothetical protein